MLTCEVCGNAHDKCFHVISEGSWHVFDSFECAIHALAKICEHCSCRILGHGLEVYGKVFCSPHCACRDGNLGVRGFSSRSAP